MSNNRDKTKFEYILSHGVIRIGLLLACIFLLQHLFIEPRALPIFNPFVDAALVLGVCAILGYLGGLVLWHLRGKKIHDSDENA